MATRVRFGNFDFDPEQRELRREGVPVRLQAQPAQVLALLLNTPAKSSHGSNCGRPSGAAIPSSILTAA
jgi:DNA-binding response OmpR family regulator